MGESESMTVDNGDDVHDNGKSDESTVACSLKTSYGIINCARCIAGTVSKLTADLSAPDAELAQSILVSARASGSVGITTSALWVCLQILVRAYVTDKYP